MIGAGVPAATNAAEMPDLFGQLKKPAYRGALTAILRGRNVAPWVKVFLATGNGVVSPGKTLEIGGRPYEQYDVCEPHNCGGNFLYVLFTPGGAKAWALLTVSGSKAGFYGNPDRAQQQALGTAAAQ